MSPTSSKSKTSNSSNSSNSSLKISPNGESLIVPRGLKYFQKPKLIMFRFLDVIKSKHNLTVEILLYARNHLQEFLERHWDKAELVELINELRDKSIEDKIKDNRTPEIFCRSQAMQAVRDSILLFVGFKTVVERNELDLGIDCPPLKKLLDWVVLEGMIDGNFCITIDKLFVDTFKHLETQHVPQLLFSSVTPLLFAPQKRLLTFTDQGDLTSYFKYYDLPTRTRCKDTYLEMASNLKMAPKEILFVAFSETECKKACKAGYRVIKIKQRNQNAYHKYKSIAIINDVSEIRICDTQ